VIVVAPERQRSAASHAITLHKPLRLVEVRPRRYSLSGTPVDCVYLGMLKLCDRVPTVVVSGVNDGFNLGSDVFYSGTVAAAVEGALRDIPAMAVSLQWSKAMRTEPKVFDQAVDFAHALAHATLAAGLPRGTLLNVNVPDGKPRGYQWTRLGRRVYRDQVDERKDLRGRRYYWIGGPVEHHRDAPGSDCAAIDSNLVAVTPLDLDLTHTGLLSELPGWKLSGFEAILHGDLRQS
jgi:5'-nucleotidase